MTTSTPRRLPYALALALVLAVSAGLQGWAGTRKQGYHVDEGFSYLVASLGALDFYPLVARPEPVRLMGSDLLRLYDLDPADHGRYRDVVRITAGDVHPPLYYLLLHEAMFWTGGRRSPWQGIGLNVLLNLLGLLVLDRVAAEVFPGRRLPRLLATALWASSLALLGITLFIRMYALFVLLALASLWIWMRIVGAPRARYGLALAWTATVTLGGLTHYYFLPWSLALAGLGALHLRRDPPRAALLFGATLLGLVGLQALFPATWEHLSRSCWTQDLAAGRMGPSFAQYLEYLRLCAQQVAYPEVLAAVAAAGVWLAARRRRPDGPIRWLPSLAIVAAAFWVFAASVSPYRDVRYLAPILPLFCLAFAALPLLVPGRFGRLALLPLGAAWIWHLAAGPLLNTFPDKLRPFQDPAKIGIIYVMDSTSAWRIWDLFPALLPEQRYLLLTRAHLTPDASGRCPANTLLPPQVVDAFRSDRRDVLFGELP